MNTDILANKTLSGISSGSKCKRPFLNPMFQIEHLNCFKSPFPSNNGENMH